jgi:hypothetical protein
MYISFGDNVPSTRTRTQVSDLDAKAMGTTDPDRLMKLCQQGSPLACRYAGMPGPTAAQKADMASNRDAQAVADRSATADRLVSAGVNPRIAEAVRTGNKDVIYAKDIEDAERTVRENFPDMADEILDDFYKFRTPWYQRTKTWAIAGAIAAVSLIVVAVKS